MEKLTVNDLITMLEELPENKRELPLFIFLEDAAVGSPHELLHVESIDETLEDRVDINVTI